MFQDLVTCLSELDDPRIEKKSDHLLVDVLAIAVCAVLAHADSFDDMALYGRSKRQWLSGFLQLPGGIPSHDTFRRVFMLIDGKRFEDCFLAWVKQTFRRPDDGDGLVHIAIDGKTMRRSFDRRNERSPLHVVSAFATKNGLVLAQKVTANKGGEFAVLPELLKGLELAGTLVSLDALACHQEIANAIINGGGDYLIALKGNQKKLHTAVRDYFTTHAFTPGQSTLQSIHDAFDDSHGRTVRRRVFVQSAGNLPEEIAANWPSLNHVLAVETIRCVNHTYQGGSSDVTTDIRYFLTSAKIDARLLAQAIRNHWAIENSLHWVLDMVFREDECRVRNKNAATNLAILRKIAINLVRADQSQKGSIKGKRKAAGWDNEFMRNLIAT